MSAPEEKVIEKTWQKMRKETKSEENLLLHEDTFHPNTFKLAKWVTAFPSFLMFG